MLSNWFTMEFPTALKDILEVPIDEAGLEDYDPDELWCVSLVICLECGEAWKACWTDGPGNEFILDCPNCGAHHSAPIVSE
jgi:hypothetical protein